MGTVQINADGAGGQKLSRAFTASTSNLGVYCRVRFPTLASTWAIAWNIRSAGTDVSLFLNGGTPDIDWDNGSQTPFISSPSAREWYDIAIAKNGTNVDIHWKFSGSSVWNTTSLAAATFTPTTFTMGSYPGSETLANKPTQYAKIVVYAVGPPTIAKLKAEANDRALQATPSSVWFYNACSDASLIQVDQSGNGHDLTVTGGAGIINVSGDPWTPRHPFGPSSTPGLGGALGSRFGA